LVTAHVDEPGHVLDEDRAGPLAPSTGRAGPDRLRLQRRADDRRQLGLGPRDAGGVRDLCLMGPDTVLQILVHALVGERLPGDVRGAVGLAAAALGAAVEIEAVLPGE